MDDHDRVTVLETRVQMAEEQHERDIQRLARNFGLALAVMAIVIPILTAMILRP